MASPTQWTCVWARSGRWGRSGKPGVLQSMGSQSQTWLSELNWGKKQFVFIILSCIQSTLLIVFYIYIYIYMYTQYMHINKYIHIYFIYVFIFGCPGSSLLHVASGSFAVRGGRRAGLEMHGFSCCGVRALGTWSSVVAAPGLSSTGSAWLLHGMRALPWPGIKFVSPALAGSS